MDGKQLLDQYMSKRDYSNSEEDQYAVLLSSIVFNCAGFDIYKALETAAAENKKLSIVYPESTSDILVEDIQPEWIKLI